MVCNKVDLWTTFVIYQILKYEQWTIQICKIKPWLKIELKDLG